MEMGCGSGMVMGMGIRMGLGLGLEFGWGESSNQLSWVDTFGESGQKQIFGTALVSWGWSGGYRCNSCSDG